MFGGRSSYDHLEKWYNEVLQNCGTIPSLLVGNKADLPDRAVSTSEAQAWAAAHQMRYYEASAKTGQNVGDVFGTLAKILVGSPVETGAPGATIISTSPPQTYTPTPQPTPVTPQYTAPKSTPTRPQFTSPPPRPTSTSFTQPTPPPKPQQITPQFTAPPPTE